MKRFRWAASLLLGCILLASSALADVSLPAIIGDNMVLQQKAKLPIWGTADPGERVTVTVDKQQASATADRWGRWKAELRPLRAGGPYEITVAGKNTITLKNVLVGARLALAARKIAYGQKLTYSGPIYKSMKVKDGKARLTFKHIGGGLETKGGGPLKGFAVAGQDSKFVWAEASIEGKSVVVWSDKVPNPVAVRYAWANNPVCNLYNKEGLPASPFRTDDWPGVTVDKR